MKPKSRLRRIGDAWARVVVAHIDEATRNLERYADAMRPPTCPYCHARMKSNSMSDGSDFWWTCECTELPEHLKIALGREATDED